MGDSVYFSNRSFFCKCANLDFLKFYIYIVIIFSNYILATKLASNGIIYLHYCTYTVICCIDYSCICKKLSSSVMRLEATCRRGNTY
uniref:SJCHGC09813 protein n=1 Tax=Schistosoma japonicum TaxID=6182 RepID=Q5BQT8_SCHJA|nr:SJCHGC09813 protein [Schistosoma japonicum]